MRKKSKYQPLNRDGGKTIWGVWSSESQVKEEGVIIVSNTEKSFSEVQYENSTLDLVRWKL